MIGSASTARFSGRTVTHPDAETTKSKASVETPVVQRRRLLEVDTESSFVDLCIAIRVFGEDGQVARFEANENAKKAGVTKLVDFRLQDLFTADFRDATVVTLYLLPDLNVKLRPRLWAELKPGTRIVSHQFDMGEQWPPDKSQDVNGLMIYLWTIR